VRRDAVPSRREPSRVAGEHTPDFDAHGARMRLDEHLLVDVPLPCLARALPLRIWL
jgi:hypothetical protein